MRLYGRLIPTYAIVLAVNAFTLLVLLVLSTQIRIIPFLLFVPAISISLWYGDLVAGLFSIIFDILAVGYLVSFPNTFDLLPIDVAHITLFLIVIAVAWVLGANHRRGEEARLRMEEVADFTGDAIIGLSRDGDIKGWSKGAENLFGYSSKEVKGWSISNIFAPGRPAPIASALQRTKRGEPVGPFEIVHLRPDGSEIDLLVNVIPNRTATGRIIGVSCTFHDVTERKRTQAWLYNLADAVENTSDVVIITNREGVIEYVNPAFETTTGYSREEALGKTPRLLKSGQHDLDFYKRLWKTILSGKIFHGEFANRKKNGELYYELKTITSIKNPQGHITHFVSTGKDVSDHTRARQNLEQQIEERSRALSTLYDVTAVASTSLDLQTIFDQSLDRILTTMNGSKAEIYLVDENNDMTRIPAASRRIDGHLASATTLSAETEFVRWVIVHSKLLATPGIGTDSPNPTIPVLTRLDEEDVALVAVPIMAGSRLKGALSIKREKARPFTADEVTMLGSIGAHLGVTIEHIQLFKEAARDATRTERERLAHELHDSVTQNIYSSTLFAEAASRFITAGDAERAKHYVIRFGQMAQQSLKEMRLLVYELRPLALEKNNLAEALQQRLDAVEKRAGIDARLQIEGVMDLPAPVEEALYRVAQEALSNSLKHAIASSVNVQLLVEGKRVELEIDDNGKGFDPDSATDGAGLGLISMRRRVEQLGGTLAVASRSGEGTQVTVSLPLEW